MTLAALFLPQKAQPTDTVTACKDKCWEKRQRSKLRRLATPFGRWAIPSYVVMCESHGNFHAYNGVLGAGGAYQIIPGTWNAYLPSRRVIGLLGGDHGPQFSGRILQHVVAHRLRQDQGLSPWACA